MPIGLTEIAWASMWYFATVILGFLFVNETLGWFGAAHRILMALHTFVWMYFTNLLPSIARCAGEPVGVLQRLMERSIGFGVSTACLVAFLVSMLADPIMTIAFGAQFAGGSTSLTVLAWLLPVAMLSGHYRYTLLAYSESSRMLICTVTSAVMAILMGVALVPVFGATGAAVALLLANIANLGLTYLSVKKSIVHVPFLRRISWPLVGTLAAFAVLLVTHNVWIAAGVSVAQYLVYLISFYGRDALQALGHRVKVVEESAAA